MKAYLYPKIGKLPNIHSKNYLETNITRMYDKEKLISLDRKYYIIQVTEYQQSCNKYK